MDEYLPALPFRPRVTVDLDGFEPSPAALALLPEHGFERGTFFTLGERGRFLLLAVVDPRSQTVRFNADRFRRPIRLFLTSRSQMVDATRHHYGDLAALRVADDPEPGLGEFAVTVDDVGFDLTQSDAPVRPGAVFFSAPIPFPLPAAPFVLQAHCRGGANGFHCGYILSAIAEPDAFETANPFDSLRDIRIQYTDDEREMAGIGDDDVPGLIAELYQPENRVECEGVVVPGGEMLEFSAPMRRLILLGEPAREALHCMLDDERIRDEVVLILGAIGDESTVPLLIDRYPEEPELMVYFSFALSYLTGQHLDRDRDGCHPDADNARRWREWWASAGPTFRVPSVKPRASWVPEYPILTPAWAERVRRDFAVETD